MASCWRRQGAGAALTVALLLASATASADPKPTEPSEVAAYCAKARAQAASSASLLIAPTLRAEAMKLPPSLQRSNQIDPTVGNAAYQARGVVVVSPIQMYRGVRVLDLADADCEQFAATTLARDLTTDALEHARLAALKKQAAYLASQRTTWDAITAKVEERFAARAVTLLDADDVRSTADGLARQEAQVLGEIGKIEAATQPAVKVRIDALRQRVGKASRRFEEKSSHIRSLDPWDLTFTAGYVPAVLDAQQGGVYGVVSLSYNLGGPFHQAAEGRYLDARDAQLRAARSEAMRQLEVLLATVAAAKKQAAAELAVVEHRVALTKESRAIVEQSEASAALRGAAVLDMSLIGYESERIFLKELAQELAHLEEN